MKNNRLSQPIDLQGRTALVTGAARGIGARTACVLAREGANVAVADVITTENTVADIVGIGRRAVGIHADVSNASDVSRMVAEALDGLGSIDILVNNAGVVHRDTFLQTSEATWNRVVDIILKGTFLCIQAVYPHMKRRRYGKIVNVTSISGIIGGAVSKPDDTPEKVKGRSGPAYAAAKGGVIGLTRWLAKAGACETEMTRGFDYGVQALPIARWGHPSDMAEAILFLASEASNYITGQILNVDGGWVMA